MGRTSLDFYSEVLQKYHEIQDTFVRYVFGTEPILWFQSFKRETWVLNWDNSHRGFVDYKTMVGLCKAVGIFGPTAAIFGRDFEDSLIRDPSAFWIPAERVEQSIRTSGGLTKEMIIPIDEQGGNEQHESHRHDRGQSITRWYDRTT